MRTALALALTLAAGPAATLSCLAPDVVRSYEAARDAPEVYTAVLGRVLNPADATVPHEGDAAPATSEVAFEGFALGRDGFDIPWAGPVRLTLSCLGPWCAAPPSIEEAIFFLRHDGDARVLEVGPCDGMGGHPATQEAVDRVLACHRHGICKVD